MFVPFMTRPEKKASKNLLRRKGGGGGGGRGGGGGGGRGAVRGSSSSSSTKGSSSSSAPPIAITVGGKSMKASPNSPGGGAKSVIPKDQAFAGREIGGGTRSQVYGTSTYGSGYPGTSGRGVQGRGFPFVFYPIVYATPFGAAGGYYLYREEEYGKAENTSRPGGALLQVAFSSSNSTFHLVSDNSTITWLQTAVNASCYNLNSFTVSSILPYNSSQPSYPKPEEAIQYYRASSVVLTLDGYNDTAVFGTNETASSTPLPTNIDTNILNCINQTIGTSVPLMGAAIPGFTPSTIFLCFFMWATFCFNCL